MKTQSERAVPAPDAFRPGILISETHHPYLGGIDEGVGPNQIAVLHLAGGTQILSAKHGSGEVVLYELSLA